MKATLLIEIGVEELPPKAMRQLADTFAGELAANLDTVGIENGPIEVFATPRRIAVSLSNTATHSAAEKIEKFGPALDIAFDTEGNPTKAGEGFARSVGASIDALEVEDSDKGRRVVYRGEAPGQPLAALLQPAVDHVLRNLPIPKRMRWGDSQAAFVRPVHWLVALHGAEVVTLEVFGEQADRMTRGHRFHHTDAIELADADHYAERLLETGWVIADPDQRKQRIVQQVTAAARRLGGTALIDDQLVEEVTALVEWPVGIAGRFDTQFLALPREVLVATLEGHQRYFPVEDESGELLAGFVTVANIESTDKAQVIAGNERVVRPRLADALFFWEQDRRHGLTAHIDGLARVSFQKELGSLADKSRRVQRIAERLTAAFDVDSTIVNRAAVLAKTDLLTEMVGEFPELQGLMGRYYALDAGEDQAVADALAQQYAPAASGAPIAQAAAGRILAIADRLDTLAGIFAIGKRPSGDKDPFALRRATLGLLRTLIEGRIALDLAAALTHAVSLQPVAAAADTEDALWSFHMERLRGYYVDRGIASDRFEAVAQLRVTDMAEFDQRMQAVNAFALLPEAHIVCGAHKRIRNILRRNTDDYATQACEPGRLVEAAEKTLGDVLAEQRVAVTHALAEHDYTQALACLAPLARPLDVFFEQIMVMSEDASLRANRLALLAELDDLCRRVADISQLTLDQKP